jgi:short-subunit dehydrogenase involved in D-alanine esterification of teichoic acids
MKNLKLFEEFKYQNEIDEIIEEISILLNNKSFPRNKWIYTNNVKIYVRKSKRFVENKLYDFIDIATIEIENKGVGIFTKLLEEIEKKFPNINIFVESILNDRLYNFLLKKDFKEIKSEL